MPDPLPPDPFKLLTPEEAQAAYDSAEPVPLSEERVQQIVDYATGKGRRPVAPVTDFDVKLLREICEAGNTPTHDIILSVLARLDAERQRAERAEAERDAARSVLRQVEWGGPYGGCPECLRTDRKHDVRCTLRAALGERG